MLSSVVFLGGEGEGDVKGETSSNGKSFAKTARWTLSFISGGAEGETGTVHPLFLVRNRQRKNENTRKMDFWLLLPYWNLFMLLLIG